MIKQISIPVIAVATALAMTQATQGGGGSLFENSYLKILLTDKVIYVNFSDIEQFSFYA